MQFTFKVDLVQFIIFPWSFLVKMTNFKLIKLILCKTYILRHSFLWQVILFTMEQNGQGEPTPKLVPSPFLMRLLNLTIFSPKNIIFELKDNNLVLTWYICNIYK